MRNIIWIASYPKSGNTWVRFLIYNLLFGRPEESRQVDLKIPDIHRTPEYLNFQQNKTMFVQTHQMFHEKMELFKRTLGLIYIIRNPVDVLASNLNFYILTELHNHIKLSRENRKDRLDVNALSEQYVGEFLEHKGDKVALKIGAGTWGENVLSYLSVAGRHPSVIIKYEDLKKDTVRQVERICKFLCIHKSREDISRAVENSSFSAMRQMEEREINQKIPGRFYKPKFEAAHKHGLRFINKGTVAWGRGTLSVDCVKIVKDIYSFELEKAGYVIDPDSGKAESINENLDAIRPLPAFPL